MRLAFIVAHDPNLVIGKDGELPWHYPEDLKFFKRTTMGHPMLMGRGVFESIGEKPLPGRKNVVLSRSKSYENVPSFTSIDEALNHLKDEETVFVIGGGEIYRQMMPQADRLYITEIHQSYEGDTWFPEYRDEIGTVWEEIEREDHSELSFVVYERLR
jgi:dihydrofolate reductase